MAVTSQGYRLQLREVGDDRKRDRKWLSPAVGHSAHLRRRELGNTADGAGRTRTRTRTGRAGSGLGGRVQVLGPWQSSRAFWISNTNWDTWIGDRGPSCTRHGGINGHRVSHRETTEGEQLTRLSPTSRHRGHAGMGIRTVHDRA